MKSVLGLSAAVALGLVAGLSILVWWMPTIVVLRSRRALALAGGSPRRPNPT